MIKLPCVFNTDNSRNKGCVCDKMSAIYRVFVSLFVFFLSSVFKLDFIFYLVWPLKAIFLFSFYVKTANKLVPEKYWSIRSMQNTSNEVFVLCKIMFTVEHTSTEQDLERT